MVHIWFVILSLSNLAVSLCHKRPGSFILIDGHNPLSSVVAFMMNGTIQSSQVLIWWCCSISRLLNHSERQIAINILIRPELVNSYWCIFPIGLRQFRCYHLRWYTTIIRIPIKQLCIQLSLKIDQFIDAFRFPYKYLLLVDQCFLTTLLKYTYAMIK